MSALKIDKLSCSYQSALVLKELKLTLHDNEIVCLLGESGCGKTTLLKAVAGLHKKLKGDISIQGEVVNNRVLNAPPEDRKVGLIFQDYALFPHLNVFDNVAFSLKGLSYQEQAKRVLEMLSLVKLQDFVERFPHQLSGGQQQRVAIARALAYQPNLMLLDEPFSNLDQHVRFQLIDEIRLLFKQRQISALFVTHSKEEGFAFADRIALMQAGRIVQIASPETLYNQPCSRYVADFMGKSNYIDVSVVDKYHYQSCFGLLRNSQEIAQTSHTQLQLLLRPEHIAVELDPIGEGVVKQVVFQGSFQKLVIKFAGHEYTVKHSIQGGDGLFFKVDDVVSLHVLSHDFVTFKKL